MVNVQSLLKDRPFVFCALSYIIRSQCLNKLGRAQEAIEDAEVALGNDRWVAEVTGGL